MEFFRSQLKEEIFRKRILPVIAQPQDGSIPFIIAFSNPPRRNLCFSNVITNLHLNIPILRKLLIGTQHIEDEIMVELRRIAKLPNFSKSSSHKFRCLVKKRCFSSGQHTRNFSDNNQHDASEFLSSTLEHIFSESDLMNNFNEELFGGLCQTLLQCTCGVVTELEVTRMTEVIPIQLSGKNLQE